MSGTNETRLPNGEAHEIFSLGQRDAVRDRVLELASGDERIVAGAVIGSLAQDGGDRWSDLDLTFGVKDETPLMEVLDTMSSRIVDEFSGVQLFDLESGTAIYRVFLLPGCLQFDLSLAPASAFTLIGSKVELLFGEAKRAEPSPASPEKDFGYAVHHLVRARFCIERDRPWQAEYWLSGARDLALSIACQHDNLNGGHGRGFDQLPEATLGTARDAIVRSLDRDELRRALRATVELLLVQGADVSELAEGVESQLLLLTRDWRAPEVKP